MNDLIIEVLKNDGFKLTYKYLDYSVLSLDYNEVINRSWYDKLCNLFKNNSSRFTTSNIENLNLTIDIYDINGFIDITFNDFIITVSDDILLNEIFNDLYRDYKITKVLDGK